MSAFNNYSSSENASIFIDMLFDLCINEEEQEALGEIFSNLVPEKRVREIKNNIMEKQNSERALPEPLQELVNSAGWEIAFRLKNEGKGEFATLLFDDACKELFSYFI